MQAIRLTFVLSLCALAFTLPQGGDTVTQVRISFISQ